MKPSIEQLASDLDFLKVQKTFHTSRCSDYQKALAGKFTGVMCFTYLSETDPTDRLILEEPNADSATEIQSYVRRFANDMAAYHHAKVLLLHEQIEQLAAEIHRLHLSATQQGKGGSVPQDTAPAQNG